MSLLSAGSVDADSSTCPNCSVDVTRFINIAFSGSYTYTSHNADVGGGPQVTTKATFRGSFKNVPARFRLIKGVPGVQIATPFGKEAKGTITGSFSVSSGGQVDPRLRCDVARKTYRIHAMAGVSGQQEYYAANLEGFRRTWYTFSIGTHTRADESDTGLICPFSPNNGHVTVRYPRERRASDVGLDGINASWYLAHKQPKVASMSYPMNRIYRGQKIRPLDMRATNIGTARGGGCLANGYECFRRVAVKFRVTPGRRR